ncbi:hypothetical protein K493DRAFT_315424 [Basidiobolus meristosporus CBS 931.73]|uniref:Uncharacterized protein n=1 Tax=Basidiobolus meristosporus CBS 931.73 TaxID=1314790 RepID=A0A1Y1Y966_9FUNG|nr:hypothetical protein K493DRAFT_315424 [Basidiobolus meristosporus CBS 931.73]|eukprot:ORX94562.1 hypothetical protein K493DRAFT_315424 [Basidiobolus meristosporus CBS 931.73]
MPLIALKGQPPVTINTRNLPPTSSEGASPTNSKSVRFSRFEKVYFTHSPEEYDRSPVRSSTGSSPERVFIFPPLPTLVMNTS